MKVPVGITLGGILLFLAASLAESPPASPVESLVLEGREVQQHSVPSRGRETLVYVLKDMQVICYRQSTTPKAVVEWCAEHAKPVDEKWSRAILKSRSCLVVSASDEHWKGQSSSLNRLRTEGDIWALGQVVKFDRDPKSAPHVLLDRVGFDTIDEESLARLRQLGDKHGFTIVEAPARPAGFPGGTKYLATSNAQLSAIELLNLLNASRLVKKVQPTWVSPPTSRER